MAHLLYQVEQWERVQKGESTMTRDQQKQPLRKDRELTVVRLGEEKTERRHKTARMAKKSLRRGTFEMESHVHTGNEKKKRAELQSYLGCRCGRSS